MRKKKEPKTKVIFRAWKDGGDVVALFPELSAGLFGTLCVSYMHSGQHGSANIDVVLKRTRPTTRDESAALRSELESIGYKLEVRKRFIRQFDVARAEAQRRQGRPVCEPIRPS